MYLFCHLELLGTHGTCVGSLLRGLFEYNISDLRHKTSNSSRIVWLLVHRFYPRDHAVYITIHDGD